MTSASPHEKRESPQLWGFIIAGIACSFQLINLGMARLDYRFVVAGAMFLVITLVLLLRRDRVSKKAMVAWGAVASLLVGTAVWLTLSWHWGVAVGFGALTLLVFEAARR